MDKSKWILNDAVFIPTLRFGCSFSHVLSSVKEANLVDHTYTQKNLFFYSYKLYYYVLRVGMYLLPYKYISKYTVSIHTQGKNLGI